MKYSWDDEKLKVLKLQDIFHSQMFMCLAWYQQRIAQKWSLGPEANPSLWYGEEVNINYFAEFMEAKVGMESVKGVLMEWPAGGAAMQQHRGQGLM